MSKQQQREIVYTGTRAEVLVPYRGRQFHFKRREPRKVPKELAERLLGDGNSSRFQEPAVQTKQTETTKQTDEKSQGTGSAASSRAGTGGES